METVPPIGSDATTLVIGSDAALDEAFQMEILHSPELVAWTKTVDARLISLSETLDKIGAFCARLEEGAEGMGALMESLAPMLEGLSGMAPGAFGGMPTPRGFGG